MKEWVCREISTTTRDAENGILTMETELIRCKDCKYYTGYECIRAKVSNIRVITDENEYCSRAERKEECG